MKNHEYVDHYVYFAHAQGGKVKVGMSSDPLERISDLNTASPYPISLVCSFVQDNRTKAFEKEHYLHLLLKPFRQHGEWFDFTNLMTHIIYVHEITLPEIIKVIKSEIKYLDYEVYT